MYNQNRGGKKSSVARQKRREVERANAKHGVGVLGYMRMAIKSMDTCSKGKIRLFHFDGI